MHTLFIYNSIRPMRRALLAVLAAVSVLSASAQQARVTPSAQKTTAATTKTEAPRYEIPAPLNDRPSLVIKRTAYVVSYNKTNKTPNWVAWHLTRAHTYGKASRENEAFSEDLVVGQPRATLKDYYNSRYDRGHMCPAGDNKWDQAAMRQTFLLSNICPQNHGLNKYEWNDVEQLCREWARKYGAVDVVCGPVYDKNVAPRYIGSNKVRVPDAFFKVVLCRQGKAKALGFVFRNEGKKVDIASAVCSVDEVERLTGIDFFPLLDDALERQIEAKADLKAW